MELDTYTLDMMGDVDEKKRVEFPEVRWLKGVMIVLVVKLEMEEGEENRGADEAARKLEVITRGIQSGAAIVI